MAILVQRVILAFASEVFPRDLVLPAGVFYLDDRRYFATANAPTCLPMAVPTSVEFR